MTVERGTLSDIEALSVLFDDYRIFYGKPADRSGARNFLEDRISNNESVVFVAKSLNGTPGGFVQLYPLFSSTRLKRLWLLNDLFVAPAFRRNGTSRVLIETAKVFSRETGACGLLLETAKTNNIANSLYIRTGFTMDEDHNYYFWGE